MRQNTLLTIRFHRNFNHKKHLDMNYLHVVQQYKELHTSSGEGVTSPYQVCWLPLLFLATN